MYTSAGIDLETGMFAAEAKTKLISNKRSVFVERFLLFDESPKNV